MPGFRDDFGGTDLDLDVWVPHYLPVWSSRAATTASYDVRELPPHTAHPARPPALVPRGPPDPAAGQRHHVRQLLGPGRQTVGQQPIHPGQMVKEQQPTHWGWTPAGGRIEIRCAMRLSPRSMAAFWMVGLETVPERSAEICVTEVFGKSVEPGRSADVGMGLHKFRDPDVGEDFAAPRLDIDVATMHDYAVDWTAERCVFYVDDREVRTCPSPPTYPMQMMLAVFDFPEWSTGDDDHLVPELVVEHLTGTQSSARP